MKTIHKAGGIVLSKEDPSKIALVYRGKHQDWSFPKGHVEDGEAYDEAARREISEETGLTIRMLQVQFPPLEYAHPSGDEVILHIFLMQSEDDSKLKKEFESDQVSWVPYRDVYDRLSHDNIRKYFESVKTIVEGAIQTINYNEAFASFFLLLVGVTFQFNFFLAVVEIHDVVVE
jgi:ADP-ribose pyrophosphatase YjhB (NUDIX family)